MFLLFIAYVLIILACCFLVVVMDLIGAYKEKLSFVKLVVEDLIGVFVIGTILYWLSAGITILLLKLSLGV